MLYSVKFSILSNVAGVKFKMNQTGGSRKRQRSQELFWHTLCEFILSS